MISFVDGPTKYTDPALPSLLLRSQWASINWPRPTVSEIVQHECWVSDQRRMVEHMRCRGTAQCVLQH